MGSAYFFYHSHGPWDKILLFVLSSNIIGSQMGFFPVEVKNYKKITNFVDLIVNIVDGHRLKLLIFIRRVGNGLFKSV
jgi:hypothetical protein